jgi:hypothetical protein
LFVAVRQLGQRVEVLSNRLWVAYAAELRTGGAMKNYLYEVVARVQSDYDFYVEFQCDPAAALEGWSLNPQERETLLDPVRLADALERRKATMLPPITIKISGSHDWINRAAPRKGKAADDLVAEEIAAISRAGDDGERKDGTLRLIRLIG